MSPELNGFNFLKDVRAPIDDENFVGDSPISLSAMLNHFGSSLLGRSLASGSFSMNVRCHLSMMTGMHLR